MVIGLQAYLLELYWLQIYTNNSYGKATQIYAQAQLLYDQMVGFGKPALAIRWEQNKNKDRFEFNTSTGAMEQHLLQSHQASPRTQGLASLSTTTSRVKRQRYPLVWTL
jgi:hypothetical protein